MLQCGTCSGSQVCYNNACCQPQTCQQLGKDCNFPSDGCGGTVDCGPCPGGSGCGSGGVPNVCAPVVSLSCAGCPGGTTQIMTLSSGDCGGGTCVSPASQSVCLVNGAQAMYGCDYSTACPPNWQIAAGYLNCGTCPGSSNYWVCVPP
jgi:hypothetical protein